MHITSVDGADDDGYHGDSFTVFEKWIPNKKPNTSQCLMIKS